MRIGSALSGRVAGRTAVSYVRSDGESLKAATVADPQSHEV
jgi:hypothetical protein